MRYKVPEKMRTDPNEPLTQYVIPCYFPDTSHGFYAESQSLFIDHINANDYASWGVESLVIDYGWWPAEPAGNRGLDHKGDWRPDPQNWQPDGMTAAGKLVHDKGMTFALYFLLHDGQSADPRALSASTHPEWFNSDGRADLGDEACRDFVQTQLLSRIEEYNVDTYRSDFEPIIPFSNQLNRHRYGAIDATYWAAKGFYGILDHFYAVNPSFRWESCSGGGSLKDFASLSRTSVIYSIESCGALQMRQAFYDSSYSVPPMLTMLPNDARRANLDEMTDAYTYTIRSGLMGAFEVGVEYADGPIELFKEYFSLYRDYIRPLVRAGNVYHLPGLPRANGVNWDGIELFDPARDQGVVFVFKPNETAPTSHRIWLKGLNPERTYALTYRDRPEQNAAMRGVDLLPGGSGLLIADLEGRYASEIIWINMHFLPRVNDDETDGNLSYGDGWVQSTSRGLGDWNDDVHVTARNGASCKFAFEGDGLDVIGERGSDLGEVDIQLDGVRVATKNCYNSIRLAQQRLFSVRGLKNTRHTVEVTKRSGALVAIDAFQAYDE